MKTLTIVGLGLIGGSIARAVKEYALPYRVTAVVRNPSTGREALESGAVDRVFTDPAEGAVDSDLAVMALPVLAIPRVLAHMAPRFRRGTVVTDVGSTKLSLLKSLEALLPPGVALVGGHPIAGTEDSGFGASFPELFRGARCILTPGERSTPEATAMVTALWEGLGSHVEVMDAAVHDRILAVISHLPHVVAYALVNAAAEADRGVPGLLDYTGGGFRDFTRIAASHPAMWRDICLDNRDEILRSIDLFLTETRRLYDLIEKSDPDELEKAFASAQKVRRNLPSPNSAHGDDENSSR